MTARNLGPRVCRVCGCSERAACAVSIAVLGPPVFVPCSWVEYDLCSGCVDGAHSIPWHTTTTLPSSAPIRGTRPTA